MNSLKINFTLLLSILFYSLSFTQTTYFVDQQNGKNSNNGTTLSTAFNSIDKAIGNVKPGDIIEIVGTYKNPSYNSNYSYNSESDSHLWHSENTIRINNLNGSANNFITLKAHNSNTVLKGDGANIFRITNSTYLKIEDFNIEGEVEKPIKLSMDEITETFISEERIYRLRCVEGWSMVIPWMGFSLSELLSKVNPTSKAKFIEFESVYDPEQMKGQRYPVLNWPYKEGLRIDEAMHPLTTVVTGLYGKKLPNQNGAPIRIFTPWKYGFKSAKAIVKIKFVEKMPTSSWMWASPREYGFYSNVNPNVDHPRWSQATERVIGNDIFAPRVKTLMFNGYGDEVANLYTGMDLKKYF